MNTAIKIKSINNNNYNLILNNKLDTQEIKELKNLLVDYNLERLEKNDIIWIESENYKKCNYNLIITSTDKNNIYVNKEFF